MTYQEKIRSLENMYNNVLKSLDLQKESYEAFKKEFLSDATKDDDYKDYKNPFKEYDFELRKIRDNVISRVIEEFRKEYPNVYLSSDNFNEYLSEDEYKNKTLIIYFDKLIKYLEEIESRADIHAKEYLVKCAIKLIPYHLTGSYNDKKKFKAEDIYKKNKLHLYKHSSYGMQYSESISELKKIMSAIILGERFSKAEEYNNLAYKYFKNGRLDIEFISEEGEIQAKTIAEFLEANQ